MNILVIRSLSFALAICIPLSSTATTIVSSVLLVACLLSLTREKISIIWSHPVSKLLAVFLLLQCCSVLYSSADLLEVTQGIRKSSRLLLIPLLLPYIDKTWLIRIILAFLASMYLSIVNSVAFNGGVPAYKDNIYTSLFVAYAIFALLNFARHTKSVLRWSLVLLAIIFAYYLFFVSIGRTGQILSFALLGLFALQVIGNDPKRLLISATGAVMLLAFLIATPSSFSERLKVSGAEIYAYVKDGQVADNSLGVRFDSVNKAWQDIKLNPVFGTGLGSFTYNPHNQYVLTWWETGLVGLLLLVSLLFSIFYSYRSSSLPGALGQGIVLAFSVGCLANSWLMDFTSAHWFVLLSGCCLSACRQVE